MESIDRYYLYPALSNFMAKQLWALVYRSERALEINTHKKVKNRQLFQLIEEYILYCGLVES